MSDANHPMTVGELAEALAEAVEKGHAKSAVVAILGPFLDENGRPTSERHICPVELATYQVAGNSAIVVMECVPQTKASA